MTAVHTWRNTGARAHGACLLRLLPGALLLTAVPAGGAVLVSQEDALASAFPDAQVQRVTSFLEESQARRIEELAGSEIDSRVIIRYHGVRSGEPVGTAYFDSHLVRTLSETLMVVVSPQGAVVRVEVLAFEEPPDYLPREAWFDQFDGAALDDDLALKRRIRGVTGATLSSKAATAAVRRVLAIHQVLGEEQPEELSPEAEAPGEEGGK